MKREINLKLSKPMQFVAIGGVLLIVVLAGYMLMSKPGGGTPQAVVTPPVPSSTTTAAAPVPTRGRGSTTTLLPGLPPALRRALEAHGVVVAVVYGPGDHGTLGAAKQGAHVAHAGFAALDVANEAVAQAVEMFAPATADPTVLIVRRPGTVASILPGYSDADTVAQAAVQRTAPPVVPTTPATPPPAAPPATIPTG